MTRRRAAGLTLLSALLWAASFGVGIAQRQHKVLPEAIGREAVSIAAAVSSNQYGLTGYLAYGQIVRILSAYERGDKERSLRDPEFLNATLHQAAALSRAEAASAGTFPLYQDDKGFINYCRIAFRLFGCRIEGLFYLYYLLLLASMTCYLLAFYPSLDLLWVLCVFLASHAVVAAAAPGVGLDLLTVHNMRFLPVLAILPALHLAWLILGRRPFSRWVLAGAVAQIALLTLAIQIRSAAVYELMFLTVLFGWAVLRAWRRQPWLGELALLKARTWPLLAAVAAWLFLKVHMFLALSPTYKPGMVQHNFWLTSFLSLSIEPGLRARYGLSPGDGFGKVRARELALQRFGVDIVMADGFDFEVSERVIKDEYLRIFRADPFLVVSSFFRKIPMLLKNLFTPPFGSPAGFLLLLGVSGAAAGLAWPALFARPAEISAALLCAMGFSLLPALITIPYPHVLPDPAAILGLLLGWAAVLGARRALSRRKPTYI